MPGDKAHGCPAQVSKPRALSRPAIHEFAGQGAGSFFCFPIGHKLCACKLRKCNTETAEIIGDHAATLEELAAHAAMLDVMKQPLWRS
jgi:hypothetical protein